MDGWVKIYQTENTLTGNVIKAKLHASNIEAEIVNKIDAALLATTEGYLDIYVPEPDAERAIDIIENMEEIDYQAGQE